MQGPEDAITVTAPISVTALGVAGAPALGHLTTTFRLSGGVLVDTGAAAHGLAPDRRDEIHTILLSHAHLDHTLGVPFMLGRLPLAVHGTQAVLDAVRESLLDDRIWPDLSRFATWHPFKQGDTIKAGGWSIDIGPASHTIPCVSFLCRRGEAKIALVGDTRLDDAVLAWAAVARPDVCVVECSFPDDWAEGAKRWGHQTPHDLLAWREALGEQCQLMVTHIKPLHEATVRAECEALGDPRLSILQDGDVIYPIS